jgi:hypothetical protein
VERVEQGPRPAWLVVVVASWLALGISAAWYYREHAVTTPSLLMLAGIAAYCGVAARFRWPAPLPLLAVFLLSTGIALDAFPVTWWPITLSLTASVRSAAKRGELEAFPASCAAASGWLAGFAAYVAWATRPCCGGRPHWLLTGAPAAGALVSFALAARRRSPYPDHDRVPRLALDAALGFARLMLPLVFLLLGAWAVGASEGARYRERWDNGNAAPP